MDEAGTVVEENRVRITPEALAAKFGELPATQIVIEVAHSPWVSRLLQAQGHDVVVANPRKVRLIYKSNRKSDQRSPRSLPITALAIVAGELGWMHDYWLVWGGWMSTSSHRCSIAVATCKPIWRWCAAAMRW